MCQLCDKIYNKKEAEKWLEDWDHEDKIYNIITKNNSNNYHMYTYVSDNYYTPETFLSISYCPKCGRRLDEDIH